MTSLTEIAKKSGKAKAAPKPKPATGSKKPVAKARKQATRTAFPVEQVTKMWKEGKSIEEMAKAMGRYRKDSPDPTSGFRGSLNQLRAKGVLKIGFRSKPGKKSAAA